MSGRFAVAPFVDPPPVIGGNDAQWRVKIRDMAFDASFP